MSVEGKNFNEPNQQGEEAVDLETLIRRDKKIILSIDEMDENTKAVLLKNVGVLWPSRKNDYYFVDKEGNIAKFDLFSYKLKDSAIGEREQLIELGFTIKPAWNEVADAVGPLIYAKDKKTASEKVEVKKKGFNF